MRVLRTLPLGAPPDEPTWQAEWRSALAAAKLRDRQTVDLRVTASLGPLLHWAPWSYLILVPRPLWTALASPQRQAILRHELAHLRRRDLWKSLAIRVLALPQWFNPLVWIAIRRFDEAAEWACDDAAAATDAGRLTFAASLLQSAEYAVAPYPASAPAARGVLTRRIHRLVSPRFKEESKMKLLIVPTLLAIVAIVQIVRIEQVIADEPPAAAAKPPAANPVQHTGPPLSQEQMDFDRLTKEYEIFARMDYVIEPPDILLIESDKLLPKVPHCLETFDELEIRVKGALPEQPIDDVYNVDADGSVNLGPTYGRINVVGQTIKQAEDAIRTQLSKVLTDADVSVSLHASSSAQAITGQHLVAMDGRVNLGVYGTVYVAGMTLKEARGAIELKLAEQLDDPKVSVEVLAYNSKVVYLILQGGEVGDDVVRMPLKYPYTLAMNVGALLKDATYPNPINLAAAKISVARPAANGVGVELKLPVTWDAARGEPTATTNYPLLPGDRIFVESVQASKPENAHQSHSSDWDASPVAPPTLPKAPRSNFKGMVDVSITVVEDQADALTEFRTLQHIWSITTDSKAFQSALRAFEKNGLVKIASQKHIRCELGQISKTAVDLPAPNPKRKWKFRQSSLTEVRVRQVENDRIEVKLRFEGKNFLSTLTPVMRLGQTELLECTGRPIDGQSTQQRTYLVVTPKLALDGR